MNLSAKIMKFVTMESVNLVVVMITTANRVKNVIVNPAFLLVKTEQFVLLIHTVILMIEFVFHPVNLIKIVMVGTNAPTVIVSNLAEIPINVQTVTNIATSEYKTKI